MDNHFSNSLFMPQVHTVTHTLLTATDYIEMVTIPQNRYFETLHMAIKTLVVVGSGFYLGFNLDGIDYDLVDYGFDSLGNTLWAWFPLVFPPGCTIYVRCKAGAVGGAFRFTLLGRSYIACEH